MFSKIEDFASLWKGEMAATEKLLALLTDQSLTQPKHDIIRNLGRVAWHIVTTYPEMCAKFGIKIDGPTEKDPIPSSVAEIKEVYSRYAGALLDQVSQWPDSDLLIEDDMYGETWARGRSLMVFIVHEIHHRGQLTVLMRMAGLPVSGVYGPSKEEWVNYDMEAPEL